MPGNSQNKNPLTEKTPEEIFEQEINKDHFRVTIFGSARIEEHNELYKKVFDLACKIGRKNWDIITGGGPGIMQAASAGHQKGNPDETADSIGLTIKLPWEVKSNTHLDIKKHFDKFSGRLDHFMALSNAVVVMPGGVGTCLEFFYAWQLVQVKHINRIPIILVGKMWERLMAWIDKYPLKDELISLHEKDFIYIAKNNREAMKLLEQEYQHYLNARKNGNGPYNNNGYLRG